MKTKIFITLSIIVVVLGFSKAETIHVVTTTQDTRSIVEIIGGNKVDVFAIAMGYQNPHFVDPKPSYIIKLSNADLYVTLGLDLESGWSPSLLTSSRNKKNQNGSDGYVDASVGVPLMQIPSVINREEGDIHIYGNPHYWLDPLNGKIIAQNICDGLKRISPENKIFFEANLKTFNEQIDLKMKIWSTAMMSFKGIKVIAYHNEWCYFENRFGLKIIDFMEPKPGIPPTPSQLVKIIKEVKENNIKIIITSPYFTSSSSDVVSKQTVTKTLVLATSVGAFDSIKTYYDLFDYNIKLLTNTLK
ncbi:MAG: metal ABC transporter substrate-binding protein [Bacteroidota bacterium]